MVRRIGLASEQLSSTPARALVLTRSRLQAIDPFPEGAEVVKRIRNEATHFSYSGRLTDLHTHAQLHGCPQIKPCADRDNQTRIVGTVLMMESECRMAPALQAYAGLQGKNEPKCSGVTWQMRKEAAEMEAVGQKIAKICFLAQSDSKYSGPYRPIFAHYLKQVHPEIEGATLDVLDIDRMTNSSARKAPRIKKTATDVSAVGLTTWKRAGDSAKRRIGLEGAAITDRDLIASAIDLRTCHRLPEFINEQEDRAKAIVKLSEAYVAYARAQWLKAKPATKEPATAKLPDSDGLEMYDSSKESVDDEEPDFLGEFDKAYDKYVKLANKIDWKVGVAVVVYVTNSALFAENVPGT